MSSGFLCQVIPVYVVHVQDIIFAGLHYEHRNLLQAELELGDRSGESVGAKSKIGSGFYLLWTVDM